MSLMLIHKTMHLVIIMVSVHFIQQSKGRELKNLSLCILMTSGEPLKNGRISTGIRSESIWLLFLLCILETTWKFSILIFWGIFLGRIQTRTAEVLPSAKTVGSPGELLAQSTSLLHPMERKMWLWLKEEIAPLPHYTILITSVIFILLQWKIPKSSSLSYLASLLCRTIIESFFCCSGKIYIA